MDDGPYEIRMVIKIQATGTDDNAMNLMGNVRRFLRLDILKSTEIVSAYTVRSTKVKPIDVSSIPLIEN